MRNASLIIEVERDDQSAVALAVLAEKGADIDERVDAFLNRRYLELEGTRSLSDTVPTRLSAVAR